MNKVLRSVVEGAKMARDREILVPWPNLRQAIRNSILTPNELLECYSLALKLFGEKNKVPLGIKKGIADAFSRFSPEEFNRFYPPEIDLTFKQLLKIVHPKPVNEEQSKIFRQL